MYFLIPKLSQQHLPAGMDKAAAIAHHRRAVVAAHLPVEGARRSSAEGIVEGGGIRLVGNIKGKRDLREEIACVGEYRA